MTPTRNRWLSLFLVALVAMAAGCGGDGVVEPVEGPALVRLVPSEVVYDVGESVVTDVFIEDATDASAVAFHVTYDPAVLQYVGGVEGDFMNGDGSDTAFLTASNGDEVVFALSRLGGGPGMSGTGVLATLEFLAVGAGDSGFAFTQAAVKDPQAQFLPARFSTVPVQVVP